MSAFNCKILYPDGVTIDVLGNAKDVVEYKQAVFLLNSQYEVLVTLETCQRLIAHFVQAGWPVRSNRIAV